ncbi:MAG: efflux RND transporter periplasmic adaptor subunit [Rikenellaceae bacterium]
MGKYLIFSLSVFMILSCSGKGGNTSAESDAAKADFVSEKNLVDTISLKKRDFNKQLLSNGKLRAITKSELNFLSSGVISEVYVKNGETVIKGQPLASLDKKQAIYKLDQAKQKMEKAELDFADALIGYGYGKDTLKVPADLLKIIKIRSGYLSSVSDLKQAEEDLKNTTLIAPFGGKVANLTAKPYEQASGIFCTLIDDSLFDVDFSLLESEMPFIKIGSNVKIISYSEPDKQYLGVVTQINPLIDDNGQVKILAKVANSSGRLIEGMNVKAMVENIVRDKLVVPKSAVVMRDNFDVLFRLDTATGKAMWTYVKVEASNSESHVVTANLDKNAELNIGDIIIISGNLNLADGSKVEIKKR